jgi:PAS domain S-box-containing protein
MNPSESDRIDAQITVLKETLEDLEALREALAAGAIDAIVVGPDDDHKRVLLLSGAYARYRRLVEDMDQGAVTVSRRGEIIFANKSFASLLGTTVSDLFRHPLSSFVAAGDHDNLELLLSPRDKLRSLELSLQGRTGARYPARFTMISDHDEFLTIIVTDLSREEELREAGDTVAAIQKGNVDAVVRDDDQVIMLDPRRAASGLGDLTSAALKLRALVESLRARPGLGPAERVIVDALDRQASEIAELAEPKPGIEADAKY